MKIKQIELILENCDVITIDGKYIGDFLIDNIHTSIARIACNAIEEMRYADTIMMEIHKDANKIRYQFGQTDVEEFEQLTFDRLIGCGDITSITFELVNENDTHSKKHHYYVNWTGDSDYVNEAQKSYISECGHLYIVISKDDDISDFFDMEEINDPDNMDFKFDMLDIGDKYGNPDKDNTKENN